MTVNHPAIGNPQTNVVSDGDASLDAQETTVQHDIRFTYRSFLTSGIQPTIDFHERVYTSLDCRDGKHRAAAYNACRTSAWLVRHRVTGKIRLASSRCNLRWCPLCQKTKRYVMLQSIVPWVRSAKKPKFLTLTLKHSAAPLIAQIDSLYNFFRQLRRRPYFKKRIIGGIWFFQITKSKSDGYWHPHLHILCDGRYIPQKELSSIWSSITHGSNVVDIRAVKDVKKTADYVARYATSPCKLDSLDFVDAIDVVDAVAGRRICGTFGSAKGLHLVPKKCPDSEDWDYLCGVTECMALRQSSDWHKEIYSSWVQDRYCYSEPRPPGIDLETPSSLLIDEPVKYKQAVFEWSTFLI